MLRDPCNVRQEEVMVDAYVLLLNVRDVFVLAEAVFDDIPIHTDRLEPIISKSGKWYTFCQIKYSEFFI